MVDSLDDGHEAVEAQSEPEPARRVSLSGRRSLRSPSEALHPETAPPPPLAPKRPRRRRPIIATASGLLSFIGIAAIALVVAWSLGLQRINAPGPLAADKVVTIPKSDISEMIDKLADEGVIESRFLMTAALWLEGDRDKVKAGEYSFRQAASLHDVIDTLVSGRQILHAITIPEGLTSQQVMDRLRENDVLAGDIKEIPKEGSLMPDTFKFARGTTREQIIANMQTEQRHVLAEVWANRSTDTPLRSPYDLVTLASIVEKETGRADERPRVAGVFVNRLNRNMPLQSDPTIVYGLVGGKGTLGRGILKSEVEQKTPYNTYAIVGLPPGPIANPGKAALEAVANPSRTRELYFVADGTGGHAFAENLDQHRSNVQRWRQLEKDAKDKADPDATKPTPPGVSPPPPAAPKTNQRSDLPDGQTVYGALFGNFPSPTTGGPKTTSSVTAFPVSSFSGVGPMAASPKPAANPLTALPGSNGDELDIDVAGIKSKPGPDDQMGEGGESATDGSAAQAGSMETFPVSPARLADEKSRARAYGLQPETSGSVPGVGVAQVADAPLRTNTRFGKGQIFDASEGTALDPLRDKSYDLNSAKTVPNMKAMPSISSYAN